MSKALKKADWFNSRPDLEETSAEATECGLSVARDSSALWS